MMTYLHSEYDHSNGCQYCGTGPERSERPIMTANNCHRCDCRAIGIPCAIAHDQDCDAIRSHIVIGAIEPSTEAGRLWHEEWHSGEYPGAPTKCGSAGCGFLGRILAVEAESAQR